MNENQFLREIGFALSMLNESDASYKLCALDQIKEVACDAHWDFIEEYRDSPKANNFITAGWIATLKDEVSDELAYKIFKNAGSFETKSDWEEENEQ